MEASDLKRVRELEAEDVKLKRIYADLALENTAMKDVMAKRCSELVDGRPNRGFWKCRMIIRRLREAIYWWMLEYNEERPHDSLDFHTPAETRIHAGISINAVSA